MKIIESVEPLEVDWVQFSRGEMEGLVRLAKEGKTVQLAAVGDRMFFKVFESWQPLEKKEGF